MSIMRLSAFVLAFATALGATPSRADTNGWVFVTEPDPGSRLVRIRAVVRTGGVADPENLPGLAYFTGRALLRGTRTRRYNELVSAIERAGASLSVEAEEDRTVFSAEVLAGNLDAFLDIFRDVLTQPAFDVEEMRRLQRILQGEVRSEVQEPREVARRALMELAYRGTALARPVHGTVASISRITPRDAAELFRARYVRENLVVSASGPFSREDLAARLALKLDAIPRGEADARPIPEPALAGRRAAIVDRPGNETVPLFIAVPGAGDGDPELAPLEVGNFVFGADFTSRLIQVLRVQNGWTYGAYSGYDQAMGPKREAGLFSLYTYPSVEFADRAIPEALRLLDEYVAGGVTSDELDSARSALGSRYPFELDTAEKRLAARLRGALTGREIRDTASYRELLASLSREVVNAAVASRTRTHSMAIVAVGDASTLRPILAGLPLVESVEVLDVQP